MTSMQFQASIVQNNCFSMDECPTSWACDRTNISSTVSGLIKIRQLRVSHSRRTRQYSSLLWAAATNRLQNTESATLASQSYCSCCTVLDVQMYTCRYTYCDIFRNYMATIAILCVRSGCELTVSKMHVFRSHECARTNILHPNRESITSRKTQDAFATSGFLCDEMLAQCRMQCLKRCTVHTYTQNKRGVVYFCGHLHEDISGVAITTA